MIINWTSDETHVLINPAFHNEKRVHHSQQLHLLALKGHIWVTTSGSTGPFKYVALSKEAMLSSGSAVNQILSSTKDDIWLRALPIFHVGGLGISARASLTGASIIDLPKWDPVNFHKIACEQSVTLSALVPAQVYDLVAHKLSPPLSLRTVIVGGGRLSDVLYHQAQELGWKLKTSYGLTECSSQVATADDSIRDWGRILPHVSVRIDDDKSLWISSPALLTCYGIPRGEEIEFIDPKIDGWYKTEDRAEIQDGLLKILGRGKDFIKIGGESVNLCHLQNVMDNTRYEYSLSQYVLLAPLSDERLGSVIQVVIEGTMNDRVEQVITAFNQAVMPYERVRGVSFVDQFQKNAKGEIYR